MKTKLLLLIYFWLTKQKKFFFNGGLFLACHPKAVWFFQSYPLIFLITKLKILTERKLFSSLIKLKRLIQRTQGNCSHQDWLSCHHLEKAAPDAVVCKQTDKFKPVTEHAATYSS